MIKLLITGFAVLAFLFVFLSVDRFRWHDFISGIWLATVGIGLMLLVLALSAHFGRVNARDFGQWDRSNPITQWYQTLMQPDVPSASCCGEADSYWADSFEVSRDGEYVAIITDSRDDVPLKREHIDIGTKIVVPNNKLNRDSNPTGHGIIFLSRGRYVYCYIAPGGV